MWSPQNLCYCGTKMTWKKSFFKLNKRLGVPVLRVNSWNICYVTNRSKSKSERIAIWKMLVIKDKKAVLNFSIQFQIPVELVMFQIHTNAY